MDKRDQGIVVSEALNRQELFNLHAHYESVLREELNLCFQYLNFYAGLLVAILAATLTGLFTLKPGDPRLLALLIGPLLTMILSSLGYANVRVFYSRYIQAWVGNLLR